MILYEKEVKIVDRDLIFKVDKDITDWLSEEEALPLFDKYTETFKGATCQAILMIERYIPVGD